MIVELGKIRILIFSDKVKKVRVTCKCTHVNIYQIPEPLAIAAEVMIVVCCEDCRQNYGYIQGKFARLDEDLNFEAPLVQKVVKRPIVPELQWEMPPNRDLN